MSRRAGLVQKAATDWKNALVDLGGRNNLLHYRDLKRGTLDLTAADPEAVGGLLLGKATRVSALFSDPEQRDQMLRRVRTIHNKAKENFEERGLETLSIGCGLATWENKRAAWEPCAPVLLQPPRCVRSGAAQDEFELAVVGETMEVNPTLLHVLQVDFGCEVDHGGADEARSRTAPSMSRGSWRRPMSGSASRRGRCLASGSTGGIVLANFAYAKLAMVNDLDGALDELVAHELIAALAGDEQAREAIRSQGPGPEAIPGPDQVPLADEFLVLDADSSQNYAINAVLAGQSLIIKGPPGTGKSQTIANLIASLIARGKKVLFVAEKRAAIDAVTKRLRTSRTSASWCLTCTTASALAARSRRRSGRRLTPAGTRRASTTARNCSAWNGGASSSTPTCAPCTACGSHGACRSTRCGHSCSAWSGAHRVPVPGRGDRGAQPGGCPPGRTKTSLTTRGWAG